MAGWTFHDGVGQDSAGANDAVLIGSPTLVPSPLGQALETRSTAYAIADAPGLNVNGWTGITVTVWVRPVGHFTTYGAMLGRGNDAGGVSFAINAPGANLYPCNTHTCRASFVFFVPSW